MMLAWTIFTIVLLVGFAILETIGLMKHGVAGTWSYWWWRLLFSDHIKALNGRRPKHIRGPVWFGLAALLLWLVCHLIFGGVV